MAKIRLKHPGKPVAWLIRTIAETLKFRVINSEHHNPRTDPAAIWVFWHNRMFLIPWLWQQLSPNRPATALTSPSGDGAVIADVCAQFGIEAARGSSSRRGMQGMIELVQKSKKGHYTAITPDGPRGPCYQLNMGVMKLAQLTGAKLIPVHISFERALRLKTWDRFLLPLPFSRATIEFGPSLSIPRDLPEVECEAERLKLERIMTDKAVK